MLRLWIRIKLMGEGFPYRHNVGMRNEEKKRSIPFLFIDRRVFAVIYRCCLYFWTWI